MTVFEDEGGEVMIILKFFLSLQILQAATEVTVVGCFLVAPRGAENEYNKYKR